MAIVLKLEKFLHPKDADGMAKSADPDQTALVRTVCSELPFQTENSYGSSEVQIRRGIKDNSTIIFVISQ